MTARDDGPLENPAGVDVDADVDAPVDADQRISLCETLDRLLNTGVVLAGEVAISVADVELIYVNLRVLLASFESAEAHRRGLGLTPRNPVSRGLAS
jgi:hypothetical protein